MCPAWLFLICLVGSLRQADGAGSDKPRVFCGRMLANARVLYCYGSENSPDKKNARFPSFSTIDIEDMSQKKRSPYYNSALTLLTWPTAHQIAVQAQWLRSKRDPGLVDECCMKPCFVSEILNYC